MYNNLNISKDKNKNNNNTWILEKASDFYNLNNNRLERYIKNNKFYYKNMETNEIFTNYYMG